jgi:hypothetical protein
MRLFFSLGKQICKRRLWKRTSLSTGDPSGEHGGGAPLLQNLKQWQDFIFIRRPLSLRTLRHK